MRNLSSFLLSTALFMGSLALAEAPTSQEVFEFRWHSGYAPYQCSHNIAGLIEELHLEEIELTHSKVLILRKLNPLLNPVNPERARGSEYFKDKRRRKKANPQWTFHAVLLHGGLVYDFDFENLPHPIPFIDYLFQMWGRDFFGMKVQAIPAQEFDQRHLDGNVDDRKYPMVAMADLATPEELTGPLKSPIQDQLNEKFYFSGPNCHNSSLRSLGLTPGKRYIDEKEMKNFLKTQCQETPKGQLGVLVSTHNQSPIHSFIKLGKDYVFTKDGLNKSEQPKISKLKETLTTHKQALNHQCRIQKIKNCEIKIRYYECEPSEKSQLNLNEFSKFYKNQLSFFKQIDQKKYLANICNKPLNPTENLTAHSIYKSIETASWSARGPKQLTSIKKFAEAFQKKCAFAEGE